MNDLTLVIGNCNYSSWSLRPWLFLSHHGIEFKQKRVALFEETMTRELAGYFSDTKVPILLDGDLEVWDSLAILEYLSERFPDKHGLPDNVEVRAVARSVSAEMHSSLFDLRNEMPMNCRRLFPDFKPSEAALRDVERVQSIWRRSRERYGEDGPWLFGKFSIADCMYAPVVLRFLSYGIEMDEVCTAYAETLYNDSAIKNWVQMGRDESEVIEEDEADWPSEPM